MNKYEVGAEVEHKRFGKGKIIKCGGKNVSGEEVYDVMFKFPYGSEFNVPGSKLKPAQ